MAETIGGSSAMAPTWQYVQEVISDNINKAESAAIAAEASLENLADAVTTLPFTNVNTTVGTDATTTWGTVVSVPSVIALPEFDVIGDIGVCPTVEVPGAVTPGDVVYTPSEAELPTIDARVFSGLPAPRFTTPIVISNAESFQKVETKLQQLLADEDRSFRPDDKLSELLEEAADKLVTLSEKDGFNLEHPWLHDTWEADAMALMGPRANAIMTKLYDIINDPSTQGLPSAYWDQLATEALARFSKQKVGTLRRARNSGVASYWGLPTETVLVATQLAEQQMVEQQQAVEAEIVKKRTELVREAFFKGIEMLDAIQQRLLNFSYEVKKTAIASFAQMFDLRVKMYTANLEQFKTSMAQAQVTTVDVPTTNNKMALEEWAAYLRAAEAELKADATSAQIFQAEMEGYKVQIDSNTQVFDSQVKLFDAKAQAHPKYQGLKLEEFRNKLEAYKTLVQKIESMARASAEVLNAQTNASSGMIAAQKTQIEQERNRNAAVLDAARLNLTAQEIKAKLDIEQAQWMTGQTNQMLTSLTASYVGIYQALLTVSDVNLGSSYGANDSWTVSASRNAEKVW